MTNSGLKKFVASAALFAMATATTMAGAATKGRIIPSDTVTFHNDGQIISTFTEQAPINDSAFITCNKACKVRLDGMSLNVAGETTFAVRHDGEGMNLFVKKGLVTFSVSNVTQQVSFYTPDGRYVKTEGFIAPTSTANAVKGYMNVTSSQAQIGISEGAMILATADGIQTVDSGYTYTVDLNKLPATGVGSGAAAGTGAGAAVGAGAGTGAAAGAGAAGAGAAAGIGGLGTLGSMGALGLVGLGAIGVGVNTKNNTPDAASTNQ